MFGWLNKIYNFVFQSALFMENKNYQEDLLHIRKMMEKSSRFISLTGISGVFAGLFALAGAVYVYFLFEKNGVDYFEATVKYYEKDIVIHLILVALLIMVLAVISGAYFTIRKSKKNNLTIWDSTTKKLLVNFAIPLAIGGPSPVVSQTMGTTVSKSDRVRELQENIKDYEDIIRMISNFLNGSVISQIQRIRKEIIRLLTGLELLYKNLLACSYTNDPLLEQNLQDAISTLKDNLTILDNLFPTSKTDNILPSLYNGYQINIIKEEVVDEGITLLRRRVIVADQRGITVYEGDPTYATDDQILIKEGQYVINKLGNVGLNGGGNSTPSNQDIINEMNELGLNPNNININPNDLD